MVGAVVIVVVAVVVMVEVDVGDTSDEEVNYFQNYFGLPESGPSLPLEDVCTFLTQAPTRRRPETTFAPLHSWLPPRPPIIS